MSPYGNCDKLLNDFLGNQTIEETIRVLDDVLLLLVMHTECVGLSDNLVHQYLTIRELRDMFTKLKGD
ncbi:MAG: hypothetical protein ABJG47_07665 [Ekhidna sp.]